MEVIEVFAVEVLEVCSLYLLNKKRRCSGGGFTQRITDVAGGR